ncbi:hypothetical protein [Nocardia brevicatena]|uniref:hypothetical protein n=1 Tax=Nocardia brevicatena TaxID=37327 RepID=UPI0012F7D335|nr:hypothetical protein [Nocardia brevicatena]
MMVAGGRGVGFLISFFGVLVGQTRLEFGNGDVFSFEGGMADHQDRERQQSDSDQHNPHDYQRIHLRLHGIFSADMEIGTVYSPTGELLHSYPIIGMTKRNTRHE